MTLALAQLSNATTIQLVSGVEIQELMINHSSRSCRILLEACTQECFEWCYLRGGCSI